ncbi:MAG: sialate O-acetylesterase [Kiritimatiellae bacterium]|nr:sialate O-acetylesterase [Kiritimatiellia bacterium]MDD5521956.1 sialate O-acetylesterase [Kiritimatiellia bacterium]
MQFNSKSLIILMFLFSQGDDITAKSDQIEILYPVQYVVFQRETPSDGIIRIRGRYPKDGKVEKIEARFCGREWKVLDPNPKDGTFAGSIHEKVGQGKLEVRTTGGAGLTAMVTCIGIGDLFVITGQSNADGRGDAHIAMEQQNPFIGTKYRKNIWSKGDDPSANDGDHGSPWPMVLNELIPDQKVPISYIQAAVGSTVVKQWCKGGSMYTRMLGIVKAATDEGMKVRAVLYYQGENDITHYNKLSVLGNYDEYVQNLMNAATAFYNDFQCPMLIGQITNLGSERNRNDNIRRGQQYVWANHPHVLPGAIAYDILPTDGVHYRDEVNMRAFARRWTMAILASVYGQKDFANPKLDRAELIDTNTVQLVFDRNLKIEAWNGKAGDKAFGFSFKDDTITLTDQDVVSTVISGKEVTMKLGKPVKSGVFMSYGSGKDGQGQPILRDITTSQPVCMVFKVPLIKP